MLLVWAGGSELTRRLGLLSSEARQELTGGVRWTIDKDLVRMFARKPVLGWGLGAFPIAYPQFRNLQVPANAAWFYVLAVLAASTDPLETRQRVRRLRSRHAEGFDSEPPAAQQPAEPE